MTEWFVWVETASSANCEHTCTSDHLIQVEVEPNGVGFIHREQICGADYRDEIVWTQEAPDLLRFEPVDPTTNGLQMNDFDFFTLRYEDDCRALGEESIKTFEMRRGPVWLAEWSENDCSGWITPEGETDVNCIHD